MGAVQVIRPREVALGADEGMAVRRTLPRRERTLIGGWCFVDHYGPASIAETGGMQVAPHPHTGLQTASWLFSGEVEHRDSAGHHALITPGELNLMTAGRGISHSELSTARVSELHGVQLWIALPDDARHVAPGFEHVVPARIDDRDLSGSVFIGSLLGAASGATVHSPLVGAELHVRPGRILDLPVTSGFEHGVLLDAGALRIDGQAVVPGELAVLGHGRSSIRIEPLVPSRLLLLGGAPLGESIVMWWNFIGRTHEEIEDYRRQWQAEVTGSADAPVFGMPFDDVAIPLAAPPLPAGRLRQRS